MNEQQTDNNQSQNQNEDSFGSRRLEEKYNEILSKYKESEARLKELESYKHNVESQKVKNNLYQKYFFSKEQQELTNDLIEKYNIKDFQGFIHDFYEKALQSKREATLAHADRIFNEHQKQITTSTENEVMDNLEKGIKLMNEKF